MTEGLYIFTAVYLVIAALTLSVFKVATDNFKEADIRKVAFFSALWPIAIVIVLSSEINHRLNKH